jgi:hypothetical protein
MSITGELARVQEAFDQPTLTLLHQKHAPVVLAVFRSVFTRDNPAIETSILHERVDALIGALQQTGTEVPTGSGRELCLRWMHGQWLLRVIEDGVEVYRLTSHAQDALTQVTSLSRERGSLNEHRITTIVTTIRRFNSAINPDRGARVELLTSEIDRLDRERQRLLDGGDLGEVSDDYLADGFQEILSLIEGLPAEFARAAEGFETLKRRQMVSFRDEGATAGELLDRSLHQIDLLMTQTPEGRAFEGAFALLRDDALQEQLEQDLVTLLSHPGAQALLTRGEHTELRQTVDFIRIRLEQVLSVRARVTQNLREFVTTRNVDGDRELDQTLRELDRALTEWMHTSGVLAKTDVQLLPVRSNVPHLRERFHDSATAKPPLPLVARSDTGQALSQEALERARQAGGPSLLRLRELLDAHLLELENLSTLAELFNSLPAELRRPAEVLGLWHLARHRPEAFLATGEEIYVALRPDGTTRRLRGPLLALQPTVAALTSDTQPEENIR